MKKLGIEMGIRADMGTVLAGYNMAESAGMDYYFVPETVPSIGLGVDAFDAMYKMSRKDQNLKIGTGIVSVYSREKYDMVNRAKQIQDRSDGKFVLGIGTSIKKFAQINKREFKNHTGRMIEYTKSAKKEKIPVYWGASNDNMISLAGKYADGVIFFMKPQRELTRSIKLVNDSLEKNRRSRSDFNIVSIKPVFPEPDVEKAKKNAKTTIANYIIGNKFYRPSLERDGFAGEVNEIIKYKDGREAYDKVSDDLARKLSFYGEPSWCSQAINWYADRNSFDTVVAGFDIPKDDYNHEAMSNIKKFVKYMGK